MPPTFAALGDGDKAGTVEVWENGVRVVEAKRAK